ncbi:MAG: oligoendopeptidase F [Clostridiales bacterium]|nr:oligoendopeptidase F [Candidatus Blautia equi]
MKLAMRNEVPVELTWDLTSIYKTEEDLRSDMEKVKALSIEMEKKYKGKLNTPEMIDACLDDLRESTRLISLTYQYCELAASVDYYDSHIQDLNGKAMRLASEVDSRLSFISGEIMEQPEETLKQAISIATANKLYLKDILRRKPHYLQPQTEQVLAALAPTIQAPYQIYNLTKLADMKFDSFTVNGQEYPLGYSLFEDNYEYEADAEVRHAAFDAFSKKLRQYENTTAAAYNTQVQTEKTLADVRGFDSVFDSLLFGQKVTRELYDRQINLITEKLAPHMRKYAKLLQKIHGLEKMTFADLKIAVDPQYDPKVTIEDSKDYILKGLSILGGEYGEMIQTAYRDRWVDFAKNQGKSTGGFCSSPYGVNSFILLSWNDRMADVFTLAHELGHAGHFKACNSAQSIFDTDVSTYMVEAPSTMNELIMAHYLLKTSEDKRFRRWVLSCMISNTYYHNFVTHLMEAAYQRDVYKIVDAGGSVDASTLSGIMRETLEKFWGDAVEINEGAELTWMRQPHYYMGLYSYTYSAGLTIATQACRRIEREGQPAVEDWKKVLAAGGTVDPIEFARMAGVDITTDQPLLDTIAYIGEIIDEICKLTEELE